jgi:hypothetical protein
MPASAKRTSKRARRDPRKDEAAATLANLGDSSPSRPAKRRRQVAHTPTTPRPDRNATIRQDQADEEEGEDEDETKNVEDEGADNEEDDNDNEDEPSTGPIEDDDNLVTQVTQHLKTKRVQASKDHANAIHQANLDGVKAFAKVAAQDWTFYITKLSINIGRAPETIHEEQGDESVDQDLLPHIDLGPEKMVSREHAVIYFDEKWYLKVRGRNGAKVDGELKKPGVSHALTSGQVIEIGNVEMMFVLPSEISSLHIHNIFLERCGITAADMSKARPPRRQPLIAPAPSDYKRPGTPPSSATQIRGLASATRSPAVVMGPNSNLDLSLDDNQHIKPQYSYAQMITQAILDAPEGKLNLNGIYKFIMSKYSYYRHQQAGGWQVCLYHSAFSLLRFS